MLNFRIIARFFSLGLIFEGLFMLLSAIVAFLYKEPSSILFSGIFTIVIGILVYTPLRNEEKIYGNKEGYVIITGMWLLVTIFGTLPYLMTGAISNFTDAFFESMSGFTTTGATIMTSIESQSHGILFWRSLTQWTGGIGFIIISLSLLPVDKTLNIQLTLSEFTGQATDKIHPKTREATKRLVLIYAVLTLAEVILLKLSGISFFNAFCIAFSTMSTGGFSPTDYSLTYLGNPLALVILTFFMFLAGTNMTIIYFTLKGNFKKILQNNEFKFYVIVVLSFVILGSFALWHGKIYQAGEAILNGAFQIVSIITTTGFYKTDYSAWSSLMTIIIFVLMFTGGTSGSASGSLKMARLCLAARNARKELIRIIHPNAVVPVHFYHKVIPGHLIYNLLVFILIYFIIICISSLVISFMGYDFVTSFSTSAALLGNIGHSFGSFGPFNTYSSVPAGGKWFFSFLMFLGRLELISVLILLNRNFYRR
ncbi:MAG TPA: potassium transporter TrkG [Bacteroidales bacterium]|nr:potassium transporter TrkG [Bacteroidales bacterium]HPR73611.1 potassium transporter TrkG [Bacteroidales bacterium]